MSSRVECYTVAEATRLLGRDPKTVRAWMSKGRLTVVDPDDPSNPLGEPLLLAEEVEAAADGNKVLLRPTPAPAVPVADPGALDGYESVELLRRESQLLSTQVELLQMQLAASQDELARERAQRKALLETMLADIDRASAPHT